ncbi:uncharacterized protein LOC132262641 [Phlebotomus argentipes]|uniref:uncharacterized protein LOC132262641 n=1 Tax=Phlebotomus argentipes TaxID=94469 RepID=UPI002892C80D|nr:uncharacterized protein LOC132262641 [Phlebotomus argentipes]
MSKMPEEVNEVLQQMSKIISMIEDTASEMTPKNLKMIQVVLTVLNKKMRNHFGPFKAPLGRIVKEIVRLCRNSSDEMNVKVLSAVLSSLVRIFLKCQDNWVTGRMILLVLNTLLDLIPRNAVMNLVMKHSEELASLSWSLSYAGEYRNQRVVMLFLYRCLDGMDQSQKTILTKVFFPDAELDYFRRVFMSLKPANVEPGIRACLNEFNDLLVDREIVSFAVSELQLGKIKCSPRKGESIWINFNRFPFNISIYCSSLLFFDGNEEKLMMVFIPVKTIKSFVTGRMNFEEELRIVAKENFTFVDVEANKSDNFLEINELRCTFFVPERNKDNGNETLKKIQRIVMKANGELKQNRVKKINKTIEKMDFLSIQSAKRVSFDAKTQPLPVKSSLSPLLFTPKELSPILYESRVEKTHFEESMDDSRDTICSKLPFRGFLNSPERSDSFDVIEECPESPQKCPPQIEVSVQTEVSRPIKSPKASLSVRRKMTPEEIRREGEERRKSLSRHLEIIKRLNTSAKTPKKRAPRKMRVRKATPRKAKAKKTENSKWRAKKLPLKTLPITVGKRSARMKEICYLESDESDCEEMLTKKRLAKDDDDDVFEIPEAKKTKKDEDSLDEDVSFEKKNPSVDAFSQKTTTEVIPMVISDEEDDEKTASFEMFKLPDDTEQEEEEVVDVSSSISKTEEKSNASKTVDVFDFAQSKDEIPDISKAIDKFLKDANKENTVSSSDDVFNAVRDETPVRPVTKRKLFNPQEQKEVSVPKAYKFFKSRNDKTPSPVVVVDSELSQESENGDIVAKRFRKLHRNIAKVNEKVKKEPKEEEEKLKKRRSKSLTAPLVKRCLGQSVEAGIVLANITPRRKSIYMKSVQCERNNVTVSRTTHFQVIKEEANV